MLSVSDKSVSINERTQEIIEIIKLHHHHHRHQISSAHIRLRLYVVSVDALNKYLHILGVWQNACCCARFNIPLDTKTVG